VIVLDNAVDHTADVQSIDYLNGTVTFKSAYTVTGAVTITAQYVPTTVIAKSRSFTLTQGAAEIDETSYDSALANGGWREYQIGLKNTRLEIRGIYDASLNLQTALASRSLLYIDVAPANDANTIFRGFFKRSTFGQAGDVGALEDSTVTMDLFVPDGDLVERPFGWYFSNNSNLNTAVKKALGSWQNKTPIKIQYLPDGVTGYAGDAIVTECTLANSFDGLNEFRFTFRGDGAPAVVP
jgi:predicted secreted protein